MIDIKQSIQKFKKIVLPNEYNYEFLKNLSPELYPKYLKMIYKSNMGKSLNLEKPKKFSEKVQWLKLYDNYSLKTDFTDKITVKDFITNIFNGDVKTPFTIQKLRDMSELNLELLPDKFVIKTNHGYKNTMCLSKENFIAKNEELSTHYNKLLKLNYAFLSGFELQYKDIVPKIIIEEKLLNKNYGMPFPYSFMCFNGDVKYIEHVSIVNNKTYISFQDTKWNVLPFYYLHKQLKNQSPMPTKLFEMIEVAKTLAKQFKLVRVDLYEVDDQIYFSELTFTPCSGFFYFNPNIYDDIYGEKLEL